MKWASFHPSLKLTIIFPNFLSPLGFLPSMLNEQVSSMWKSSVDGSTTRFFLLLVKDRVSFTLDLNFFLRLLAQISLYLFYLHLRSSPYYSCGKELQDSLHFLYDCLRVFRISSESPVLPHSSTKFAGMVIRRLWKEKQSLLVSRRYRRP